LLAAGIKPLSRLMQILIAEKTANTKYLDFLVKIKVFGLKLRLFLSLIEILLEFLF